MRSPLVRSTALAACLLCALSAQATDLLDVWRAASLHDPQAAIALAQRHTGDARHALAQALWRPTVGLSGTAGVMSADSRSTGAQFAAPGFGSATGADFATSVRGGASSRLALQARQPLWNPERTAQARQLQLAADSAELAWQAAQQELMQSSSQQYLALALLGERLQLLRQQQTAVDRALTEAQDRFALGDKPVTDTHEASARALGLRAQAIATETEVEIARATLADSTGLAPATLQARLPGANLAGGISTLAAAPLARWLALAEEHNPGLRLQQLQVQVAEQELARHRPQAGATLDLVAQASRERLSGSGAYGAATNSANQAMFGVQLNLPLYTGGYRSARQQEAQGQLEQAQAELARARQQVAQQTRATWRGLQAGQARLQALEQAHKASLSRRDATALGRQVGDRTTLDLLQAENDTASAALALQQARVELLLQGLRLHALAGQLDEAQLALANAQLVPN